MTDVGFRHRALRVLANLGSDDRSSVDIVLRGYGSSLSSVQSTLSDPAIGRDHLVRACALLAKTKDARLVPALVAALRGPDGRLRAEAARSLAVFDSTRATAPLVAAMKGDELSEVRAAAAYALGLAGHKRSLAALINVFSNQKELAPVRGAAAEALANFHDTRVVTPLVAGLKDSHTEVRFWSAFALGEVGDYNVVPELERLVISDSMVLTGWWAVGKEAAAAIRRIQARMEQSRPE